MSVNSSGKSNPPTHKGSGYGRKNHFSNGLGVHPVIQIKKRGLSGSNCKRIIDDMRDSKLRTSP